MERERESVRGRKGGRERKREIEIYGIVRKCESERESESGRVSERRRGREREREGGG